MKKILFAFLIYILFSISSIIIIEDVKVSYVPFLGDNIYYAREVGENSGTSTTPRLTSADCANLLTGGFIDIFNKLYGYIKLIVPVLLILLGTADFAMAVISSDDKALKKVTNRFVRRAIIAIAIFFLPSIINLLLSLIGKATGTCGVR